LIKDGTKLLFRSNQLPFCHLDLSRRNILLREDGTLVLLDWADAGFYPKALQIWSLKTEVGDCKFAEILLQKLQELNGDKGPAVGLLGRCFFWNSLQGL